MRRTLFAALAACFVFASYSPAQTSMAGKFYQRLARAQERANGGPVIVGQVVVEDGDEAALVDSQMLILENGFFAGPTKDLTRPVGFRMHGYEPVDVQLNGKVGDVVDVGVIKMKRLPASELMTLKGFLSLEDSGDPTTASISLRTDNGPTNTPSNGTEPRPRHAKPVKVPIEESGMFTLDGFSPARYYCTARAPGYLTKGFYVDFAEKKNAFVGRINLEKPRRLSVQYIVSADSPFDLEAAKQKNLQAGDRWKATPDIYGWDLEFQQKHDKLLFTYSYGPCYLVDLGKGDLEDFLETDEVDFQRKNPRSVAVQDGHVYLLIQKHWDRNVLFKLELESKK